MHLLKKGNLKNVVVLFIIIFSSPLTVVLGKVRSAVGSAQLLMSQKFQQFRGLCEQNLVCILRLSILRLRCNIHDAQLVANKS